MAFFVDRYEMRLVNVASRCVCDWAGVKTAVLRRHGDEKNVGDTWLGISGCFSLSKIPYMDKCFTFASDEVASRDSTGRNGTLVLST